MFFNLVVAGVAWGVVPRVDNPAPVLAAAVLAGGVLQALVQAPAVRRLGFAIAPLWSAVTSPRVGQVLLLMLPGIPVLGINQINQLISNRFASFIEGGVSYTYGAYRVTELVFGLVVVQITTVLLPLLSKELGEDPRRGSSTLLSAVGLVTFVTLPTAVVLAVLGTPVIGVLFGGGRFTAEAVAVTGATLSAYAFSLVGTGHVKVMASAFFAQKNTRTPMWGSLVALVVFTAGCSLMVGAMGTPGLGWANTIAMWCFGTFLTVLYARRYGFDRGAVGSTAVAVLRQSAVAAAIGVVLWRIAPWLAVVENTSLDGLLRLLAVLVPTGVAYVAGVTLLGGSELKTLLATIKGGGER
jgi:putative peptidoglycan lipid II flippase